MIEDKLTHDERLRLECLSQAVAKHASFGGGTKPSDEAIISTARSFEKFMKEPADG